ncbi:MAG: hybrid sensor histidine kinase/response regulator transcription factor [Phocaeicola sp.]
MKKNLFISIILLLVIFLTACTSNKSRYSIAISQCSDDEWRSQMNHEMEREALFYDGVDIEVRTANDDSQKQIEDIEHFIKSGVDLLIVAPNEAAPITPMVEKAFDLGIPVIVIDRKVLSEKYTAYIGADNYKIGRAVGDYIVGLLSGKGRIVEIAGLQGSTPAMDRHRGFVSALSNYPKIELLESRDASWLQSDATHQMDSLLLKHVEIDVVFAQNDRMAAGARAAAVARGREEEIYFIGIDALPGDGFGIAQVLNKELDATFIYPTGGDKVIQLAMNILENRPFERETLLETAVVDQTNAAMMHLQTVHIAQLDTKIETIRGMMNHYLSRYAAQQLLLWGSLFALTLVIALLIAVYFSLRSKNRLNTKLSQKRDQLEEQKEQLIEQKELLVQQKEQLELLASELEEATQAKLVFFTNVSHDFRTPLTLIADPVNQLLAEGGQNERQKQLLTLVKKNTTILLRLVNQILDFRKIENGKMTLHLAAFDLKTSMEQWSEAFQLMLVKKQIHFRFTQAEQRDYNILADQEKMERIYFNLLSNAAKYTNEGGTIRVHLSIENDLLNFSVFNSGSYISPSEAQAIFTRFYQIDGHQAGTGIGLALVHAFVKLHGGEITMNSNDEGTTFSVQLPLQLPVSSMLETISDEVEQPIGEEPYFVDEMEGMISADKPTLLVIDDNADIRNYMASLLEREYTVIKAPEAQTGIALAMKYVPDLIISDVMMPGMDGITCCQRLKNELQTCHIPVILLTACSLDEQRIQGYNGGADSYISKPFEATLLLSRIKNLIASRRQLKDVLGDQQLLTKEHITDMDKGFVAKFKALVAQRMKEPELNVEELGKEMGLSRVQLYRKLKSLTNYAPNELLRQMRLKKAKSMLSSSDMSISEIAYEVGFSSPSYFTKCYKEQFKESPTDFLKRKNDSLS